MTSTRKTTLAEAIYNNRDYQYYLFQLLFWTGLILITFFSLTLWYNTVAWPYITHTLSQGLLGVLMSFPLRGVYTYLWERNLLLRVLLSLVVVALVSGLWTVVRMLTFIWIVQENKNLWAEFGGWYFASFFIFLCWTALYYGVKYYNLMQEEHAKALAAGAEAQAEMYKRLKAEAKAKEAQLKMLRYQLNPHFLFNTLNAIYALIKLKDNQTAQQMVQQLSKFLRYSLDNDPVHRVNLHQELEALKLYLNIEQVRFAERLQLDIAITEEAKPARIPSLLLQPLVENAIKYAISPSENGGTIGVRARVEGQRLCIEVWDTGPGLSISEEEFAQGRGVGLRNTMERLKTLYEDDHRFELGAAEPNGLKITIDIPYEPETETERERKDASLVVK